MKIAAKLFRVCRFAPVIHLFVNHAVEFIYSAEPFGSGKELWKSVEQPAHAAQQIEIELNALFKVWALNLDRRLFACRKPCFVDLAQARRRDGVNAYAQE